MILTAWMSSGVSLHGVGDGILKSSELFPRSNFMLVGPGKLYTFLGSSSCYQKNVPLYSNANKEPGVSTNLIHIFSSPVTLLVEPIYIVWFYFHFYLNFLTKLRKKWLNVIWKKNLSNSVRLCLPAPVAD